jgi:hypothetical protein
MATSLTDLHLLTAAVVCLVGSTIIHALSDHSQAADPSGRWRRIEEATALLALLSAVAGLGLATVRQGALPLVTPEQVITATSAAAMLWRLLNGRDREPKWGATVSYAISAGLLLWALMRRPAPQASPTADAVQLTWRFVSHLVLALACGAFVQAGSLALASLVTERQSHKETLALSAEKVGQHALLPGLSLLTVSLIITALGGQYTRGVAWSWTTSQSWQLLAWLFYAVIWWDFVLIGWRGRRVLALAAMGLIMTFLVLSALGG